MTGPRSAVRFGRSRSIGREAGWPDVRKLTGNDNIPAKVEWPDGVRRLKAVFSFRFETVFGGRVNSPVPIDRSHDTASFDCGVAPLNEYLKKYALLNHQNRSARTYVAMRASRLIGYYTLAAGSVSRSEVPPRVAQGLGQYPVPITLLARLAVDDSAKGKGLGRGLLKDTVLASAPSFRNRGKPGDCHPCQGRSGQSVLSKVQFRSITDQRTPSLSADEGHPGDLRHAMRDSVIQSFHEPLSRRLTINAVQPVVR
jgi:hypothetical protein